MLLFLCRPEPLMYLWTWSPPPALTAEARQLRFYCLSTAVADTLAPLGASKVKVARQPNAQEMLAALAPETPEFP